MNAIPQNFIDFIHKYKHFMIVGHLDPDMDCIGSQISMSILLKRLGKKFDLFSPGPFKRSEIKKFEPLFKTSFDKSIVTDSTAVIVCDCSSLDRIQPFDKDFIAYPIAVVDHHSSGEKFCEVQYIDTNAPSCSLLIQNIIEKMDKLLKEDVDLLFGGFATDTGMFKFLNAKQHVYLGNVSRLMELGASPKDVYQEMNSYKNFNNELLLGTVLARSESFFENKVICTAEYIDERSKLGASDRDAPMLYEILQSVENNEVCLVMRQEEENKVVVGLRSKSYVDVGALSARFGGGGHIRAAGFSTTKKIDEIKSELLGILKDLI